MQQQKSRGYDGGLQAAPHTDEQIMRCQPSGFAGIKGGASGDARQFSVKENCSKPKGAFANPLYRKRIWRLENLHRKLIEMFQY